MPVDDPSAYGLVRLAEDGDVRGFLEKPEPHEIDTDLISAGAYVLERSVLDLIEPNANVSIERVVWPALVGNGLQGTAHRDAYWLDIGTPERYLAGTIDILAGRVQTAVLDRLGDDGVALGRYCFAEGDLRGPVVVGDGCRIAAGAVVGPNVALGRGVVIEAGALVENAVILADARIHAGVTVRDAIVCEGAQIGERSLITGTAVVGPGTVVGADNVLDHGMRLFPGVTLPDAAVAF